MVYINKLITRTKEKKSFFKDIIKMISGTGLSQVIAFAFLPLISRLFLPEDFATQALFLQIIGLLVALLSLKFEQFILFPKDNSVSVSLIFVLLLICLINTIFYFIVLYFFGNYIYEIYKLGPTYLWYLLPFCSIFMVMSLGLQVFLQKFEKYSIAAISDIVNKSGYVLSIFILYYFSNLPYILVFALVLGFFLKFCFLFKFSLAMIREYANEFNLILLNAYLNFKKYFSQAIYFTFSDILVAANGIILSLFISNFFGLDFFGSWAFVQATLYAPTAIAGNAAGQVYMQRASRQHNKGKTFKKVFITTFKLLLSLSLPIFLIIMFFGVDIYSLIFGANWNVAGKMASIMSISFFFGFISNPLARSSLIVNKKYFLIFINAVRLFISILLILISKYFQTDIWNFIWLSTIFMSVFYAFEILMNYTFARKNKYRSI
tara:strand:+ start:1575 stop:2876 length:1302 start_codon:yes stop_codon:yes gene_type:complete